MQQETILANGQPHAINVAPITLLCHHGDIHLEVPGRVEINAQTTLAKATSLHQEEWFSLRHWQPFQALFHKVVPDQELPETLRQAGTGVQHVVGMILLIMEAFADRKQPFIRYPESFLHPRYQANLADLFVQLSRGGAA